MQKCTVALTDESTHPSGRKTCQTLRSPVKSIHRLFALPPNLRIRNSIAPVRSTFQTRSFPLEPAASRTGIPGSKGRAFPSCSPNTT